MGVPDYAYTRPRKPTGGMHTGPGPASYNTTQTLIGRTDHDPRSKHIRCPAYSHGKKFAIRDYVASPGPIYAPDTKVRP